MKPSSAYDADEGFMPENNAQVAGGRMLPVLLMEPTPSSKRRSYSKVLLSPKQRSFPSLEAIKQRLKELRPSALDEVDSLVSQLEAALAQDAAVRVSFASNAEEAVEAIGRISGDTKTIAINKSAVVAKELEPELVKSGFQVIESYCDEFESLENRFSEYWQLPNVAFESVLESLGREVDLTALRQASLHTEGVKEFVGVLGVNAISATDGAVFFLQHFYNIGRVFQQAKKVVLVVGLDKIAKDRDDAAFQTKCMAVFGSEARLLDLPGQDSHKDTIEDLPFEKPVNRPEGEVDIILLDNGRRQLLQGKYKELFTCIGCRACIRNCPTYEYYRGPSRWSPKEYLSFFLSGQNPSLQLCLYCGMCRVCCPLGIAVPEMMLQATTEAASKQGQPVSNRVLANFETMGRLGSSIPWLTNTVLGSSRLRWVGEKTLGISRERKPPRFQGRTFVKWFRSQPVSKG